MTKLIRARRIKGGGGSVYAGGVTYDVSGDEVEVPDHIYNRFLAGEFEIINDDDVSLAEPEE